MVQESCAVVGVYSEKQPVAGIARELLIELNHRGQESSGIAITNGRKILVAKKRGLAETIFNSHGRLPKLPESTIAVGHNRYSTSGSLHDIQPFVYEDIILAHNGNLTNIKKLKRQLRAESKKDEATCDSWFTLKLIAQSKKTNLTDKVSEVVSQLEGAFSFVIASKETLIGVRDPWGFRPLVLGKLNSGYVFASETSAIFAIGAKPVRSIFPGEILSIHKEKIKSMIYARKNHSKCIFELIYIQRPDSVFDDISVQEFRIRCGSILGRKAPEKVDAVVPVPRSGISSAIGISEKLKIPYREAIYTNPYRGAVFGYRTFIKPHGRKRAAAEKYSILREVIREYPRIILVDDSIVRGVTMKDLIEKLRKAGAYKIHLRIASPPLISACHMGVDFAMEELFASKITSLKKRAKYLGVDSLVYLNWSELIEAALGNPVNANGSDVFSEYGFCGACFNRKYPLEIGASIAKTGKR